ncbi:MAG: transferase hexapeptide repeat containing protein [Nitrospirae bacterium]|nr:MAG: transferase hexapeptide repeat containing protein [Nitrospirota bacterium]
MEKIVRAFFGNTPTQPDPLHEPAFAEYLCREFSFEERTGIFDRFRFGESRFDYLMRRILAKTLLKKVGCNLVLSPGVAFPHPETLEIGNDVFIGAHAILQGRRDGSCRIGNKVWIGAHCFFDTRDLIVGDFVGWGPGSKVLGSEHTADAPGKPIIATDLRIRPVRVHNNCDIGVNAVIMPGVTIGEGCIIGAGAVVTKSIEAFHIAAGVPAKTVRKRA